MPLDMISDVMILRTTLRVIKSVVCRKAFDRIWSKTLSQISTLETQISNLSWEELDINEWPNDFELGDLIRFIVGIDFNTITSKPSTSKQDARIVEGIIGSNAYTTLQCGCNKTEGYVSILYYKISSTLSAWNNPVDTQSMIDFYGISTSSNVTGVPTLSLDGENMSDVILRAQRIKNFVSFS